MSMPQAWADLIEGLALLAQHPYDPVSPLHCESSVLTVMANRAEFTPDELVHLAKLGFFPSDDGETFTSHRFGSA